MRAMLSELPGGPESLKLVELPSRPLGKGQVRVAVKAAGVNFPDTLIDRLGARAGRRVGGGTCVHGQGLETVGLVAHGTLPKCPAIRGNKTNRLRAAQVRIKPVSSH